ncbi:SHOCT domain-containing protein, partial [Streptomyces violaceoruber]
ASAAGAAAGAAPAVPQADQDPAAVVFGLGYGPVHESLPFAAAVLAAVRERGASPPVPIPVPAPRRDPADIAERIRHLGELHQQGLVTDEEFSSKKAELLAEL